MIDSDPIGARQYLLSDLNDTSEYVSVQYYRDNAINPCLDSTYEFIRKVIHEVKALHAGIQPLEIFHFGGDEVPNGAWIGSPQCEGHDVDQLKAQFAYEVSDAHTGTFQ